MWYQWIRSTAKVWNFIFHNKGAWFWRRPTPPNHLTLPQKLGFETLKPLEAPQTAAITSRFGPQKCMYHAVVSSFSMLTILQPVCDPCVEICLKKTSDIHSVKLWNCYVENCWNMFNCFPCESMNETTPWQHPHCAETCLSRTAKLRSKCTNNYQTSWATQIAKFGLESLTKTQKQGLIPLQILTGWFVIFESSSSTLYMFWDFDL